MNNFYNHNNKFEQLLQNEAEQFCVYPSDKVWANIRTEMHPKKRWPALIFMFVSIVSALIVTTVIYYPPHKKFTETKKLNNNNSVNTVIATTAIKHKNYVENIATKDNKNATSFLVVNNIYANNNLPKNSNITATEIGEQANETTVNATIEPNKDKKQETIIENSVEEEQHFLATNNTKNLGNSFANNAKKQNLLRAFATASLALQNNKIATQYFRNNINAVAKKQHKNKWQYQMYATPSVSYRVLEDDKSRREYTTNVDDKQALNSNVNDMVHHKPAVGAEFGIAVLYPITKNFFVKTGLQFNVRKYGIEASKNIGQSNISYVENNQLNTISYSSKYSTKQSNNDVVLDNSIYQLAVPIGFQWNVVEGERWGISTAASIQPTITLNKSIYVISTDYKTYTDGTPFFRKWNINTSAELLLTLKSGNAKWFVGPQVRYQQLPTYNNIYPIKEYRVDYGIKIGFTKYF